MENFALALRRLLKKTGQAVVPHLRQVLRFLALPWCYFFLVDWKECQVPRPKVARDLLFLFFVHRNFPDNYGKCRLFEKPRDEWAWYYGSVYNPHQRGRLRRTLQPVEYEILFVDKLLCEQVCIGTGLDVSPSLGVLDPARPLPNQIEEVCGRSAAERFIAKPIDGDSGRGILLLERNGGGMKITAAGRTWDPAAYRLAERCLVQEFVQQHADVARIHESSVNTVRLLTMMAPDGSSRVLSVLMRFGRGESFIDNWSAGGVAVGVERDTGHLMRVAYDRKGRSYEQHPDSGVEFDGYQLPLWQEVLETARRIQSCFPYYRMLGLDLAIGPAGPRLIEINANPDVVLQEQTAGPLLRDADTHGLFRDYGLLYNRAQAALHRPAAGVAADAGSLS